MLDSRVLVIDIGGSHVKCFGGSARRERRFKSGPKLTPEQMVEGVQAVFGRSGFARVSIGYPGAVRHGRPEREPVNLGRGWIDFDFEGAFRAPVRMVNDAAMQALGCYRSGTMLFLGFGTGLGTAAVVDGTVLPLELAHLPYRKGRSYEFYVGASGLKRAGVHVWRRRVIEVVDLLRAAFLPDDLVVAGGNAFRVIKHLPDARLASLVSAFTGGVRLWQPVVTAKRAAATRTRRYRRP